jgi:hypothetical protein
MLFHKIFLERGMAYGDFPIYTVTVFGNGMVHWYGKDHVKHLGPAFWSVPVESIQLLERRLAMAPVHLYQDKYWECHTTDRAWDVLEIVLSDGSYKRIDHYQGDDNAPVELNLLEQAVEDVAEIWPFVGEFGEWQSSEENPEHRLRLVSGVDG